MSDDEDDTPQGKRRVLKEIKIARISAVDSPCQQGALATILKRREDIDDIPADVLAKMTPAQRTQAETALAAGKTVEIHGPDGKVLATAKRDDAHATQGGQKQSARARDDDAAVVKITSHHQELLDAKITDEKAPQTFDEAVRHVARRDRKKKSAAMSTAAKEFPKLFTSYQSQQGRTTAKAQAPVKTTHTTQTVNNMHDKWDELVNMIAERDKIPKHRAMAVARKEQPDVYAAWVAEGNRSAMKMAEDVAKPIEKSAAVVDFEKMVSAVQVRDGLSRVDALHRAAVENPRLLEQYQAALS